MSIGQLRDVAIVGPSSLTLSWDDGRVATVDLASVIAGHPALAALAARDHFAAAARSTDGWSVEWPGGIDFGSAQLRRWADEQAGMTMPAADFRAWLQRHDFTLDRAADALGLSRRTIAYYLSGELPVPKTVMLATEGVDRRMAA